MKLSIVILSYNTKDYLKQTLDSINKNDLWEIIVADNGSTDGSKELVEEHFPHVRLIKNKKNLGFSAGNNQGIKQALGKYVMLLNSDTQVIDDAMEQMIDYLDNHKKVGVIGPKFILPDGAIDLACHRGFPTIGNALTYFLKLEQLFPNSRLFAGYHRSWEDFDSIHEIPVISGGAMIVRKKALDKVGLLDENFFLYAEDIDWCKRFWDAGWKIVYYPKATIIHHKKKSGRAKEGIASKRTKSFSNYHFFYTMKQYYNKHYQHHPAWWRKIVELGINVLSGRAGKKDKP